MKVVTVKQMRALEAAADAARHPYDLMMQIAGAAVALEVRNRAERIGKQNARIVVLCGPGNNGGDGLVAARILQEETSYDVSAYLLKPRSATDPVYQAANASGVLITNADEDPGFTVLVEQVSHADVLVDALLGIGARLPIEGTLANLMQVVYDVLHRPAYDHPSHNLSTGQGGELHPAIIIAVDCPSGLDCDSGAIDQLALRASSTVTFAAPKFGHFSFPGAAFVGDLVVSDIGLPDDLGEWSDSSVDTISGPEVRAMLPLREIDSHKGTFGRVLVVGASGRYTGAVGLSAMAAYRSGAGLVTAAVPDSATHILASSLLEPTWLPLPSAQGNISEGAASMLALEMDQFDSLILGPGLGRATETERFMTELWKGGALSDLPAVIDADALTHLSHIEDWWHHLTENTILTPHPGEMARLTGVSTAQIQADRLGVAHRYAELWGCVVVLKGAFTIVAAPLRQPVMIPLASDALATAGTGDVLAGLIGGLLAQGMNAWEAAVSGAYLHGVAGRIAADGNTARSLLASDVLNAISESFRTVSA